MSATTMKQSIRKFFFGLLAFALLGTAVAADAPRTGAKAEPVSSAAAKQEYVLSPGDVIKISVFQNPDLSVDTRVSETGTISFPLIGTVQIGGLGIGEAERKIAKALKDGGYLVSPQVNILVTQIRGSQVAVLGQVARPGRFPLEVANMKVTDAIALAGGVTPVGADIVTLKGTRSGKPVQLEVDLPAIFQKGEVERDLAVASGDTIFVPKAPMFYIYGEVQRPGQYKIERDMTVIQALATGGGLTLRGTVRGLRIQRKGPDGKVDSVQPKMEDMVQPDDTLQIQESLF